MRGRGQRAHLRPAPPSADLRALATADPQTRLTLLATSSTGLSGTEAELRLRRTGSNEPIPQTASHPIRALASQFTHTLALLLWFAAGLAFASGISELGGAIVAVVMLNGLFAFIQEYRAEQVVASLMRHVAVQSRVSRDGTVQTVPAAGLVSGDIVHVAAGDIVPADCVVLESDNLELDLSMLTGESAAVDRMAEAAIVPAGMPHIGDIKNLLPSGSGVVTGRATAVVFATGPSSSIGQVAGLVAGVRREQSILERQVARVSRSTAVIAVMAGGSTLVLATFFTATTFLSALTFGTGVIVALVPEGLLPTLSISLAIGARRMAERGAAVRRLSAVEVVGSATVICTDKTGTLTENILTVEGCAAPDGTSKPSTETVLAAVLCNDAVEEGGQVSGDPLDVALWQWAQRSGIDPQAVQAANPRRAGIAFDARRRYMQVTCQVGGQRRTFVKGAPEDVLGLTAAHELADPLAQSMSEATSRGDRVLLFAAGGEAGALEPIGLIRFSDPPRAGVPAAIAACRAAGVRVVMLTGDHAETAQSVARTIGLIKERTPVALGRDVDLMSDAEVRMVLAEDAVIAQVDPQQKLRIVRALQAVGEVVIVTGDGVNDAPALRSADVGVAMGRRGTEVAKQAADIVLADDNFATIVAAIEEGRSIKANIRRFISYVFTSNVAEMAPFLVYIFLPVPLPLAVIQALAVDIGTDLLPALALGAEPPSQNTMRTPPEAPLRPLLTREVGLRTFLFFGVIEALLGLGGFFLYYVSDGWSVGESFAPFEQISREAATITFLSIVGGQVGCLFAQRDGTLRQRLSLKNNHWVLWGLVFELALAMALVYVPGLNSVFSMSAVQPQWILAIPAGALTLVMLDFARRRLTQAPLDRTA